MRTANRARIATKATRNQRATGAILCETRFDAGPSPTVRARARSDSCVRPCAARLLHRRDRPQPPGAGRLLLLPLVREPAGRQPRLYRSVRLGLLGDGRAHRDASAAVAVPALRRVVVRGGGRSLRGPGGT